MLSDKDSIKIVMCSDERGVPMMHMALKSLFDTNREELIDVHILTDGLSARSADSIAAVAKTFGRTITIHTITAEDMKQFDIPLFRESLWPASSSFRLLIGQLLPELHRVIYLDTDILVRRSLLPLWQTDLEGSIVAGTNDFDLQHLINLDLKTDEKHFYINSGVLLIDLDAWRKVDLGKRLFQAIVANQDRYVYPDQDALNETLYGQIKLLPSIFNVTSEYFVFRDKQEMFEGQKETIRNAVIIHFAAYNKPWFSSCPRHCRFKMKQIRHYCNMEPRTEGLLGSTRYRPAGMRMSFSHRCKLAFLKAGSFVKQQVLIPMGIFLSPKWKVRTYDPFPDA